MKTLLLSLVLPLAAQAETLALRCGDVELSSRDLENYQLRERGRSFWLQPTFQDEQMVQLEKDGRVYQFVNLGGCIDSSGSKVETLLVLSERLDVLRPFAAQKCICQYR